MASVSQGGRPRNAWTPARERKLVRLYILTNLSKNEIQRVLEAPNFKPSTSDIQKRLRSLFPKDYAKDHRRYRPSNGSNMAIRLRRIRQYGGGRISKSRKTSFKKKCSNRNSALWYLSCLDAGIDPQMIDYSKKIFRDYSTPGAGQFRAQDPICSGSFPTIPERLMLDGSMTQLSMQKNVSSQGSQQAFDEIQFTCELGGNAPVAPIRNSTASSSIISIASIARRLGRPYSQTSLEHIRSVLRVSHIGSFRSSIISIGSLQSIRTSTSDLIPFGSRTSLSHKKVEHLELEDKEQTIWDELVDESQLSNSASDSFSRYSTIQLGPRPCCQLPSKNVIGRDFLCTKCGFSTALSLQGQVSEKSHFDTPDFYGNTSSHYAAAALKHGHLSRGLPLQWLKRTLGENFDAVNCNGQTVLHMVELPSDPAITQSILYDLLHQLSELGFRFSRRDYHGQTSIHALIQKNLHCLRIAHIKLIFEVSEVAVDVFDIFGWSLKQILCSDEVLLPSEFKDSLPYTNQASLQLRPTSATEQNLKLYHAWLNAIIENNLIDWVDNHGNTILIGLLKSFELEYESILQELVDKLLKHGAQVHIRDRNGDTALMIAATRGFRACVKLLLNVGANIHARNFMGVGILQSTMKTITNTSRLDESALYSKILSTLVMLVDVGVKLLPSDHDEWIVQLESNTINTQTKEVRKQVQKYLKDIRMNKKGSTALVSNLQL